MSSLVGLTIDPNTYDIMILRGDDQIVRFTVTTSTGAVQDITGWSFAFTVKSSLDDAIGSAKFQKTTGGGGIALTTPLSGIVDVTLASANTSALAGNYYYDMQGTDGSGLAHTVRLARFIVRKDVTTPGVPGVGVTAPIFVNGDLYILDNVTGLYSGFRVSNGLWEQSAVQSGTIPFAF
jgi:hypothetical protein